MKEKICEILSSLKKELNNDKDDYKKEKKEIDKIIDNIQKNIFNILELEDKLEINYINELIETLKIMKNNHFITITNEQIESIKKSTTYKEILTYYFDKSNKLTTRLNEKNNVKNFNSKIDQYIKEIQDSKIINDKFLSEIIELLTNNQINTEILIKLQLEILKYNITYYQEFENLDLQINTITEEKLIEVFEKHNHNYNKVPETLKELLLKYGNYNNIDEVFTEFKQKNIKFDEQTDEHIYMLTNSSKNIFDTIYELSLKYKFDFRTLIKKLPSAFLLTNDEIIGSYYNFINNIKTFDEQGYDIPTSLKKTPTAFVYSNKTITHNIQSLKQYGITKKLSELKFKLSGITSTTLFEALDSFLELDELKYILENTSRLQLPADSYIFKRIYNAKKRGIDIHKTRKENNETKIILDGIITKTDNTALDTPQKKEDTIIKPKIYSDEETEELNSLIKENTNTTINDELIEKLDENFSIRNNNLLYLIGNKYISKLKVHRIYSSIYEFDTDKKKLLLFAITYNSLLNSNEFDIIQSYIEELKYKKGERKWTF